MATLSIETKKFSELSEILTMPNDGLVLVHDGNGVKTITAKNFKADLAALISANTELLNKLTYNNAGAHNAIYRGKNLGTSVTEEQYAAIAAGTFDDMYIGDYWVIDGVNWRIAAFDYYLTTGDTACNTHHVTIVPDTNLDNQQMNSSNTTAGGYTGSAMYTANMATAKNKIISAFGSAHLLTYREYLVNTVANGRPSAAAWVDSQIELMTEQNVYGGKVFAPTSDGSSVPTVHTVDKSQYPLFAHDPHMISNRQTYWLRDVVSASGFASVYNTGAAVPYPAGSSTGVRPAFSIKS